jgi:hypothetical protein
LSFGNSNRSFGQRPVKRKKQDFHRHKIKAGDITAPVDFASLKERTMVSLTHLGEQLFSDEPGGYTFENWMNSFNLLLDEFEEQAGTQNLPKDYFDKRFELTSSLAQSTKSSSDLDLQILKLREEELVLRNAISALRIKTKLDRESQERRERLKVLEAEKNRDYEHLEKGKRDLEEKKRQIQDSSKLLKRLFGSPKTLDKTSLETLEARVADISSKIEGIERKILDQKKRIEFADRIQILDQTLGDPGELQSRFDMIHLRLEELEANRFEELQLLDERKQATGTLREIISKIDIDREVTSVYPVQ